MPKQKNIEEVAELREFINSSNAMILVDYRGLTVGDMVNLRRKLRETGAEFKVAKNTLLALAAGDKASEEFKMLLEGPSAVAFVKDSDPVAAAKALVDFAKDHKTMVLKGGYVEGQVLDADQVVALSKIPPRDVLISQMIGSIQSPISGLVGTLQGVISGLVYTLQSIADQKNAA